MARITTAVSIEATRDFVNALGAVAKKKNTTVAKLVKDAVDALYGNDIDEAIIFFADGDGFIHQSKNESTGSIANVSR